MNAPAQIVRPKSAPPTPETRRSVGGEKLAASSAPRYLSASVKLGGAHDPEEHEAEQAAATIAAGGRHQVYDPGGASHLRAVVAEKVVDPGASGRVRAAVAPPVLDPGATGQIRRVPAPGATTTEQSRAAAKVESARHGAARPLPAAMRDRLEHGFGQSLASVQLHTGPAAGAAASAIGARAYTEGERITLGRGESEHDLRLMAHEATHVVQNRRAARVFRAAPQDAALAAKAEKSELRAAPETAQESAIAPQGQIRRSVIDDALDWLADKANFLPGFRLFTIIIGVNPINMSPVERSGANILRAAIDFIPLGDLIVRALDQYGAFDKAGAFIDAQVKALGMAGAAIRDALMNFLDSLGWTDIFHPGDVWDRAKSIFTDPIDKIKAFLVGLAEGIIQFVKDAVLKPLAALASKTPFWDILVGVLGKNPITGEAAPPVADALVGGLLKMAGQEETWNNIKRANALARIWAWLKGVISQLVAFVAEIPSLFLEALKSFSIKDLLDLPGAIARVAGIFGSFVVKFVSWVGNAVWNLLEIVFDAVSPKAWAYIQKTGAALKSILKNPLPFVGNLVKAAKLGLQNFIDNFGDHLKAGLIDWLTGSLPGVYIPKALSLIELGKFALSVLGVTWGQIRAKIVKALGPKGETIMKGLETAFDIVVALITGGPAAAWELIKEKLTNLKDMVVDGIISFVTDAIIKKAIPKLISMFIPGAGFISAILSIYDTIKVFIEKLAKIAAVIVAFVDSIVAIAAGQISGAAKRVEGALRGLLSLAIGFFAGFVGLGNVAEKLREVIKNVQTFVDKALETAINWIIGKAKALFAKLFGGKDKDDKDDDHDAKWDKGMKAVQAYIAAERDKEDFIAEDFETGLAALKGQYGFSVLALVDDGANIDAAMSPGKKIKNDWPLVTKRNLEASKPAGTVLEMDISNRGNKRVFATLNGAKAYVYIARTGHWQKIVDDARVAQSEAALRSELQNETPGFIALVEAGKSPSAHGFDAAGLRPGQAGGADPVLVAGEVKGGFGKSTTYFPQEKFTAVTSTISSSLQAAADVAAQKGVVDKFDLALSSGNVVVVIKLVGNAVVAGTVWPKLERKIRGSIGAYLKQNYPDIDVKDVIKNVQIEWR